MGRKSKESGKTYSERDSVLREMGFQSYAEYLASDLWAGIRRRKLKMHANCVSCPSKATQVHHTNYTRETLAGEKYRALKSICRDCHRLIEFNDSGRKTSLREANARLNKLLVEQAFAKSRRDDGVEAVATKTSAQIDRERRRAEARDARREQKRLDRERSEQEKRARDERQRAEREEILSRSADRISKIVARRPESPDQPLVDLVSGKLIRPAKPKKEKRAPVCLRPKRESVRANPPRAKLGPPKRPSPPTPRVLSVREQVEAMQLRLRARVSH